MQKIRITETKDAQEKVIAIHHELIEVEATEAEEIAHFKKQYPLLAARLGF